MYTLIHICISSSLPHQRKHTIHIILDLMWNCGWKPIHGLRIPGLDEWIKKMWYVYTMEYYLAITRNGTTSFVVIWMNLEYVTSCEELTPWKRLWCWEGLGAGGEGDDRGWDGWMALPTRGTWVWIPGAGDGQGGLACCDSWGRKESDMTERLNWTESLSYRLWSRSEIKKNRYCILMHIYGI